MSDILISDNKSNSLPSLNRSNTNQTSFDSGDYSTMSRPGAPNTALNLRDIIAEIMNENTHKNTPVTRYDDPNRYVLPDPNLQVTYEDMSPTRNLELRHIVAEMIRADKLKNQSNPYNVNQYQQSSIVSGTFAGSTPSSPTINRHSNLTHIMSDVLKKDQNASNIHPDSRPTSPVNNSDPYNKNLGLKNIIIEVNKTNQQVRPPQLKDLDTKFSSTVDSNNDKVHNLRDIYADVLSKDNNNRSNLNQTKQVSLPRDQSLERDPTKNLGLRTIVTDILDLSNKDRLQNSRQPVNTSHLPNVDISKPAGPIDNLKNIMADVIISNSSSKSNPSSPVINRARVPAQSPVRSTDKPAAPVIGANHPEKVIEMNALNEILGENKGFGIVRLTVHYDELRARLSITVHEARNLKNLDKKNLSDPYARIYLTPDDKKTHKRKTKIIKSNLNPIWKETFDYPMPLQNALTKELTVNLKDERGLFERQDTQFLGEV